MQKTGAIDVYFEDTIEILMPTEEAPDDEVVAAVLAAKEIKYSSIERGAF